MLVRINLERKWNWLHFIVPFQFSPDIKCNAMTSLHLYHFGKRRLSTALRRSMHTRTYRNFAGNWANYSHKDHEKTFSITFLESVNNTKARANQRMLIENAWKIAFKRHFLHDLGDKNSFKIHGFLRTFCFLGAISIPKFKEKKGWFSYLASFSSHGLKYNNERLN